LLLFLAGFLAAVLLEGFAVELDFLCFFLPLEWLADIVEPPAGAAPAFLFAAVFAAGFFAGAFLF
jgi:hypothetical protein